LLLVPLREQGTLCLSFELLLGTLSAVLGTALVSVRNALSIEGTANDVVTHTGQVTYTSAADKHYGVLLQVVSDTRNVNGCLESVGKSYTGNLTKCRVRLLRGSRGNLCAYASLLRRAVISCSVGKGVEAVLKHRRLRLVNLLGATLLNELIKGWHIAPPLKIIEFVYLDRH